MGLFDNVKKKNEAKRLGLTVDQYEVFESAQAQGMTIEEYKRYLSSFAGRYSIDQFICFLQLEKKGFSEKQCTRYIESLSAKIKIEDYADFLEAESIGLSVAEYATYASTLKSRMSAVDYVGFLKAQKIGITMGKYLQYLKSFKGEMTIEEYDTYLKAEENGMDREHYTEYLEKYKDIYSIERYLEFDKARSLGMSLEEYDLRIEASKSGMSLDEFKLRNEAKKLGLTDDEYSVYRKIEDDKWIINDVLTIPAEITELPRNVFNKFVFREVMFSRNLEAISDGAFEGCSSLASVTIPAHIKTIGDEAFNGCSSLKQLVIEPGVERIEDNAFENCVSLKKVFVPSSVKDVDHQAFAGCVALEELEFEYGVGSIDVSDWVDLPNLKTVLTPSTASIRLWTSLKKGDPKYSIINDGYRPTFGGESKIDYITLNKYGEYGLSGDLSQIEYLKVDGDYVFLDLVGFKSLKTVEFSAKGSIRRIDNCPNLQMIVYNSFMADVPSGYVSSEKEREEKIISLKTLTLSNYNAPSLRFLGIDDGAMVVDLDHYSASDLAWIHVPAETSRLGLNTAAVNTVAIHGNCRIMSDYLSDASSLVKIRFDKDGREDGLFSNTKAKTIIPAEMSGCDEIDLLFERDAVTAELMGVQGSVKHIVLPRGLKRIEDNAFEAWGLQNIIIPETVESIGNNVFMDCKSLTSVVFERVPAFIGCDLFDGCSSLQSIIIEGQELSATEYAARYEAKVKPLSANISEIEKASRDEEESRVISDDVSATEEKQYVETYKTEGKDIYPDHKQDLSIRVGNDFSIVLPENYIYSTEPEVVGTNRALVAMLNDQNADMSNPYSATESITVLFGKDVSSVEESDEIAASIGLESGTIIIDGSDINVRYSVKESGKNLAIILALICTGTKAYPTQFFFNNPVSTDIESVVCAILSTIKHGIETSKTGDTIVSTDSSSDRVSIAKEKVDAIIDALKARYPKGSILPKSFEDLKFRNSDLALSTLSKWTEIAYDMKARDYLVAQGLLPAGISTAPIQSRAEETVQQKNSVPNIANTVPAGVLYRPGEEPDRIRQRIDRLFEKLDSAYPDKVIIGLHKDHKKWGETVTELYRQLGYPDGNSFLNAYGYTTGTGAAGRPSSDPMEVVNELKRRYANGATCAKMADLSAENPDLAPKFKNLQNQADKFFGMTLVKYFIQEGILIGKTDDQCGDEFEALKSRYASEPFAGTLNELREANADIDWGAINRYFAQSGSKDTFKVFLVNEGILVDRDTSIEAKLNEITEELKKRYPEGKAFSGTIENLKFDNKDLSISSLNSWTMQVHQLSARDYLVKQGIMQEAKTVEEKLAAVTETLKERYASGEKKAYTITDLREQNLDLPISTIGTWSKKVFGQNATEYLSGQGILSEYDWMASMRIENERREAEARAREERLAAEMAAPVETTYYEPPVYYVDEIDVSGEEANNWKYKDDYYYHIGEIYIEDYLGDEDCITIPTSINGKRVTNLDTFGLKTCKASTIKIPGSIKNLAGHLGYQNENIKSVIVGEGVETIGESCFSFVKNLSEVKVSRSVVHVGDTAFEYTPWHEAQDDLVILGSVLTKMKKDHAVLNVPHGVKVVGRLVAVFKSGLRKVVLPDTVTTLCESAFSGRGNENIQEFVFTDSLVNIGLHAFGFNKWLDQFKGRPVIINNQLYQCDVDGTSVIIPEGVTKICDEVFKENKDLKTVIFPGTLKAIGEQAFAQCQSITTIDLPDGVERLGKACFYGCKRLSKVNIPDSLIEIGRSSFNSCPALTEITLGNNVEVIGEKAFLECKMLRSISLKGKVKRILPEAFSGCSALGEITLPDGLEELGKEAFKNCASLEKIIVPSGVKKIDSSTFSGCRLLREVDLPDDIAEIADSAFSNCAELSEIKLPQIIGQQAFSGCVKLQKAVFADGIKAISKSCLSGCESLEEAIIPESVESIEEGAFNGCSALKKVVLPNSLKSIGKSAFAGCRNLESIVIPESVETLDDNAFKDCSKLDSVTMPSSISNFGLDVFTNTPYMKKEFGEFVIIGGLLSKYLGNDKDVMIPDSVTTIGENAFAEALHVESITIPSSVKTIAKKIVGTVYTWGDNPKPQLKKIIFGDGVTSIGDEAFESCEQLSEVVFGTALSHIGQKAFSGCSKLKEIDLSNTQVREVSQEAFNGCYNVKTLKLPKDIEVIGRSAFAGISLGVVELPKCVKKVERSAFDGASELIVYDTIDPDAVEANKWERDKWNGTVNSPLACAMLGVPQMYVECQGNTRWKGYHITVLSAETNAIRYRIFCDSEERDDYRAMMFSAWGKHASFTFDPYDEYFMKTRSLLGRTEMAFCRIMYPEGLSASHKENYEAFLERCLYIERSARRTAEMIANEDAVDRLKLLAQYKAIDDHNIAWIREQLEAKKATKCLAFLDENYSK